MAETILVAGTYTVDPIVDVLEFWQEFIGRNWHVSMGPHGQIFQQLLDPSSAIRTNRTGASVLCVRCCDLVVGDMRKPALIAAVDELADAVIAADVAAPLLLMIGPESDAAHVDASVIDQLESRLHGHPLVHVLSGARAAERYGVVRALDTAAERFGRVPFTSEGTAAIGSAIARWYDAISRRPIKLFASDCDNTLWSGIVGEEGTAGITIGEGHLALQRALVAQSRGGRIVGLLSKNEEKDVLAVLDRRADMALKPDDILAHRIDWNSKSDNLSRLAADFEIGLDSVVFLDDNPIECAEMRSACPTVHTVTVPADEACLGRFVDHLWLFDQPRVTNEDRQRTQMYRESAERNDLKKGAASLAGFIDSLRLRIDIAAPGPGDLERLAQLTQRTNQFNTSLLRLGEGELRGGIAEPDTILRLVRVEDRFGDYGNVGLIRARIKGGILATDLFLLSCRALGRGVEHRMLAELGNIALSKGLERIEIAYVIGERNSPARRFLMQASGIDTLEGPAGYLAMDPGAAAALRFDPEKTTAAPEPSATVAPQPAASPEKDLGEVFTRIAKNFDTGLAVVEAMGRRIRTRKHLGVTYTAPQQGLESEIARIWEEVLRVSPIGARDCFRELGGRSIDLVRIHVLLLERIGLDVDITTMFLHPTIAGLAGHLANHAGRRHQMNRDTAARSEKMRAARARAANARETRT